MQKNRLLKRIVIDPKIMCGKPVIKGTRLTVQRVLDLHAQGVSTEEVLAEYKGLEIADILACFLFASKALDQSSFVPLTSEH